MRGWIVVGCALALGGCGEPLIPETDVDAAVNAAPAEEKPELPALEPVTQADFDGVLTPGEGCDLSIDGQLLLVATNDGNAVVKWNGGVVHMRHIGGGIAGGGRFIGDAGTPIVDIDAPEGEGEHAGENVTSWRIAARLSAPDSEADPKPFAAVWSCGA